MKAYKLKFLSSFHLDSGSAVDGPSETFIHSDTLFSAVVSAARKFYGNDVAEKFLKPGTIILSSAFPFYKDELFFPKPLNFYPPQDLEYDLNKKFKKVKFISMDLLLALLCGKALESNIYDKDYILDGCWRKVKNEQNENPDRIFKTQEIPHVVMDRITNQTQIFYKTEVYFNQNAGLFFIAEIENELVHKFETVLRFLGDEGIGADRTIGKGLFRVEEIQNFNINLSGDTDFYYLLSLYSPSREEFENFEPMDSYYDFVIRGGWVSNNTLTRRNLRMFVEGSIIKVKNSIKPVGVIHKVLNKDDYPNYLQYNIYRSGQALFLPVTGGLHENI